MKNQYFGDINDYKKYSLLRHLSGWGQLKTAVCWLLTRDDKGGDGNHINYLTQSDKWKVYDTTLFEFLEQRVSKQGIRDIKVIENSELILNCSFYSEIVDDDITLRQAYFNKFFEFVKDADLIFYDPDNGLEVKSISMGTKKSSKYLYWSEVKATYESGHSIFIYQHFPRMNRESYINNLAQHFRKIDGIKRIFWYTTRHVVFFLLAQSKHENLFIESNADILNAWGEKIGIRELPLT